MHHPTDHIAFCFMEQVKKAIHKLQNSGCIHIFDYDKNTSYDWTEFHESLQPLIQGCAISKRISSAFSRGVCFDYSWCSKEIYNELLLIYISFNPEFKSLIRIAICNEIKDLAEWSHVSQHWLIAIVTSVTRMQYFFWMNYLIKQMSFPLNVQMPRTRAKMENYINCWKYFIKCLGFS